MTEQPDDSPRRVVKKVVKKTVVRPVSPSSPHGAGSPVGRPAAAPVSSATSTRPATARLTTPARARAASRPVAPAPPAASATTAARVTTPPAPSTAPQPNAAPRRRRPSMPTLSLPRPDVRGRAASLGHGIGDSVHGAVLGVRHRIEDGWDWLVSLRLPHLSPVRGSAISGILVGVLCVAIGWGFNELFSATLGTRAGGGWGFLAFVFMSFVAFVIGELLLAGFGVPHARVVSILSVLLVLLLVLLFFIRLASGVWAWLLIPTLTAIAFVTSSAVMAAAAREQNPQRLPWEPVDESQVKRD